MKLNLVRAALAGAAFAALCLVAPAVQAEVKPIQGTPVGVDHDPGGSIAKAATEVNGRLAFYDLPPGQYSLVIDGRDLVALVNRLGPPPAKKGGGASISIGGFVSGGSSRSSSGHQGAGHDQHGGSHSRSGGVGVGLTLPDGGGDNGPGSTRALRISIGVVSRETTRTWISGHGDDPAGMVTFTSAFCPDSAAQGMRTRFTVPQGPGSVVIASLGYAALGVFHDG